MEFLIALTLLLAPAYAVRFFIAGRPANLLMLWIPVVWAVFLVWVIAKRNFRDFMDSIASINRRLLVIMGVFFIAGTLALFIGGISQAKIGQYLVWFIEPMSMFFLARFLAQKLPRSKSYFIASIYIFLFVSAAYAVFQYFTLHGLPQAWWGNSQEPKRAISFFVHPNDYALFITPLLAFLLPDLLERLKNFRSQFNLAAIFVWLVGAIGLLFSLSRGGWFGLAAAMVVFVLASANKKLTRWALVLGLLGIIVVAAVPNLRWRVILPFYGERSASARSVLWETGWHMIKDNPVLGKGLLGADLNWSRYAVDPSLGHYPFPHNIFLDAWIDMGLLGLVSFVALMIYGLWYGLKNKSNVYAFGLSLFLVALLVHGQIDNSYFKNDLALVFWLIWAMVL